MAKTKPALGPQARAALRLVRGQRGPWSYRLAVAPPDLPPGEAVSGGLGAPGARHPVAPPDLPPGEAVLIHSYRRLTAGVLRALIAEGEELKETLLSTLIGTCAILDTCRGLVCPVLAAGAASGQQPAGSDAADRPVCEASPVDCAKYWTACGRIRPGRMDGQETGSADNPDVKGDKEHD